MSSRTEIATRDNGQRKDVTIPNPFANSPVVAQPSSAGIAAVNARELAEIHGQMQIARMNPRDPRRALDAILNAFARPGLAEVSMYQYSRGGQDITGLSIRAAEALAQHWGNIRTGVKELTRANGQSEVQAYAWDLETGFYAERTFHVRHWRDTKKGGRPITDERDIYELVANMGARRQRACILAVIPADVKEAAEQQIHVTMTTNIEVTPESIQKMVKYFADEFGVTKAQIEKRIQRRVDSISPAQMLSLKRIAQSLKDKIGDVSDFFEPDETQAGEAASEQQSVSQTQNVKEKLRSKQQQIKEKSGAKSEAKDDAAAETKPDTQPAPDREPDANSVAVLKDAAIQALKEAGDLKTLNEAWVEIVSTYEDSDEEIPIDVEATYHDRKEELTQSTERDGELPL